MNYITYFETLSGDTETPVSLFLKLVGDNVGFLLESKEFPRGRYSFIAGRPYMELINKDGQIIKKMEEQEYNLELSGLESLRQGK